MQKTKPSIYPDAKTGPLGTEHAQYAVPRKFGRKSDSLSVNKIVLVGTIIIAVGVLAVVWFISTIGASYF